MIDKELAFAPATELLELIATKQVSPVELTELYLAEVTAQIEDFAAKDIPFAGMLVCPLLANEGLPGIPEEFMARAANVVRAAGGLFITDEVQSGFCRTGSWWGYEVMGFVPDIVSMGKPMGNGLPLAGVVAGKELVDNYRKQTGYFNTFASSPLQAAVGMAVLEVIESEGLRENAADVGGYMRRELKQLDEFKAEGAVAIPDQLGVHADHGDHQK